MRELILGPDHEDMGSAWFNLAQAYYAVDRLDDGNEASERSISVRIAVLGEDDPRVANTRYNYGWYLVQGGGDLDVAIAQLGEAARIFRAAGGDGHPNLTSVTTVWATALARQERWGEAERLLMERRAWVVDAGESTSGIDELLVQVYEGMRQPERAAPYRS